ncbi:hypothetical protein TcCL_Unassigned04490 [Trypanosoma cruzi]|nr:hypothetical protein TcCL_Unassigned04490 [Trypanosoma cruzi]
MLSERRKAVRPAAWVIWSQRGAGRFNGRSSDTVRGVLGVPWLEDAHPAAAHIVAEENPGLSMRGADVVREDPHVATDASHFVEYGISRQRNTRRCIPIYRLKHGFQADCATHFLNIPMKCEAFVRCGCAEPNNPPQRC